MRKVRGQGQEMRKKLMARILCFHLLFVLTKNNFYSLIPFAPYGVSPLSRVDGAGAAVREEVKMENGHSSPLLGGLPEGERAEQMEGAASASGRLV